MALCAVVVSTVIRAAFHKRSLFVDSSTEHIIEADDADQRRGEGGEDVRGYHAGMPDAKGAGSRHGRPDSHGAGHGSMHGTAQYAGCEPGLKRPSLGAPVFVPP
jgi:hypothetical protein